MEQTREAIKECDLEIKDLLGNVEAETSEAEIDEVEISKSKKRYTKNALNFDVYKEGYRFYGVDLSTINGIGSGTIATLMSELGNGNDILTNFNSEGRFVSWLGLCPDNRISGGKVLSSKTRKVVNRVSTALRLAAFSLTNAKCELGNYCRKMKARLGKAEGTTAVAHKLARIIYAMIKSKESYDEEKAFKINAKTKARRIKNLQRSAEKLGFKVIPA